MKVLLMILLLHNSVTQLLRSRIYRLKFRFFDIKKMVKSAYNISCISIGEELLAALSPPNKKSYFRKIKRCFSIFNSFQQAEVDYYKSCGCSCRCDWIFSCLANIYVFAESNKSCSLAVPTGCARAQAYKFATQSVYSAAPRWCPEQENIRRTRTWFCSPTEVGTTIVFNSRFEAWTKKCGITRTRLACVEGGVLLYC